MTEHLIYREPPTTGQRVIHVVYPNGVHMGEIFQSDDGYFQWWPDYPGRAGYIEAWVLRELADKLDELNAPWDAIVRSEVGP